ncbi:MAG TPA: hypothetical protein VIK91_15835 [Nannocystis sp.]
MAKTRTPKPRHSTGPAQAGGHRLVGAPPDLRERLVQHLQTSDPAVLAAAEADYRGVWTDEHAYIVDQVAEYLPPFLGWLAAACDPAKLREGYCGRALRVWSIPLDDRTRAIFESEV